MNQLIKVKGKRNKYTYKYNNKYIYSAYDPIKEAKIFIDNFKTIKNITITCCGADFVNSVLLDKNIDLIISFEPLQFDKLTESVRI